MNVCEPTLPVLASVRIFDTELSVQWALTVRAVLLVQSFRQAAFGKADSLWASHVVLVIRADRIEHDMNNPQVHHRSPVIIHDLAGLEEGEGVGIQVQCLAVSKAGQQGLQVCSHDARDDISSILEKVRHNEAHTEDNLNLLQLLGPS